MADWFGYQHLPGKLALAALLLGTSAALLADDAGGAQQAVIHASQLLDQSKTSAALEALNAAMDASPENPSLRIARAEVLLAMGDGVGAEADLDRAEGLGAKPDQFRHWMALARLQQGDPYGARRWLSKGGFTTETAADGYRVLGMLEHATGNLPAAGAAYDRALAIAPQDSDLWVAIARLRFAGGEQGQALEAVDQAVKFNARNIRALGLRAELMRDQFGLAASLPWFEAALKIDPSDVPLLTEYAATLGDMGRMADMLAVTRAILKQAPRNPRAFFMQAVLAARAGNYRLAANLMGRTGGLLDKTASGMLMNGITDLQTGNYNQSIDNFNRLLNIQPTNRRAQLLLARAMQLNGSHRELLQRFTPYVERGDATPYLLTVVARSHEAMGAPDKAIPLLTRASQPFLPPMQPIGEGAPLGTLAAEYDRNPATLATAVPLVRSLIGHGEMARAHQVAQALASRNPGSPDAQVLLGDSLLAQANPAGAMDSFAAAARIRMSENIMLRMTEAMRRQNRLDQAGAITTQYLAQNPNNMSAARMLGLAYLYGGDWQNAGMLLRYVDTRIGGNDPLLLSDLAMASLRQGAVRDAIRYAGRAYRLQPSSPVAAQAYGMALLEGGKHPRSARDVLVKAVQISQPDPLLTVALGRAYQTNGQRELARQEYSRALAMGPFPDRPRAEAWLHELGGAVPVALPDAASVR